MSNGYQSNNDDNDDDYNDDHNDNTHLTVVKSIKHISLSIIW
jgi:hypothetical protein